MDLWDVLFWAFNGLVIFLALVGLADVTGLVTRFLGKDWPRCRPR